MTDFTKMNKQILPMLLITTFLSACGGGNDPHPRPEAETIDEPVEFKLGDNNYYLHAPKGAGSEDPWPWTLDGWLRTTDDGTEMYRSGAVKGFRSSSGISRHHENNTGTLNLGGQVFIGNLLPDPAFPVTSILDGHSYGFFDLSKPYVIRLIFDRAYVNFPDTEDIYFSVLIDNNTTDPKNSLHGEESLIFHQEVWDFESVEYPYTVEIESSVGTDQSYIQILSPGFKVHLSRFEILPLEAR